jgi:hypothetical protein
MLIDFALISSSRKVEHSLWLKYSQFLRNINVRSEEERAPATVSTLSRHPAKLGKIRTNYGSEIPQGYDRGNALVQPKLQLFIPTSGPICAQFLWNKVGLSWG